LVMKIDEGKLMAYLYGELSTTEKDELEKFFQENPDALKEYQEMLQVKSALGKITDKEVIAPPIFMDDEKPTISLWRSGFVRYAVGIAAAFFIVMVGAKLLGLQMQYSDREFTLSFGESRKHKPVQGLSPEQVQQLIDASMAKNNDLVQASLNESQTKWSETLRQNSTQTSLRLNEISKTATAATQEQIRQFMEGVRNENAQAVQDYIRLSSNDQKAYIENLLVDFSKYMQEQRNSDLTVVNARLKTLEQDNTAFREEAGQILTSLISSNNNSSVKRN
jgi:hypothetical protein